MDVNKYWVVHGGSDSYFSAKDAKDAWEIVQMMNNIAMEYGSPPTSKVEVCDECDHKEHAHGLERRKSEGDDLYFQP